MSIEAIKQAREKTLEDARRVFANSSRDAGEVIGFFYTAMNTAIAEAEKQDHWTHHSAGGNVSLPKGTGHLHTCLGMPKAEQEPVIDKSAAIRIATALGWGPKREWVGLTDEAMRALVEQAREVPVEVPCPDYNERLLTLANDKLKELNA